jgi:hypothetical protein
MAFRLPVEDLHLAAQWCRSYDDQAEESPRVFAVADLLEKMARDQYVEDFVTFFKLEAVKAHGADALSSLSPERRRLTMIDVRQRAFAAYQKEHAKQDGL